MVLRLSAEHIPTGLGSNMFHQQFSGWLWVALQLCFDTAGWVDLQIFTASKTSGWRNLMGN